MKIQTESIRVFEDITMKEENLNYSLRLDDMASFKFKVSKTNSYVRAFKHLVAKVGGYGHKT